MGKIWLACCSCVGYPEIQREVEAREASAQILRVADLAALGRMVEAFVRSSGSISVALRGGCDEGLLRTVADLAHNEGVRQVVVVLDDLDPGFIAQLFQAGATEVIAGSGDAPNASENRECPETGHHITGGRAAPPRDDVRLAAGSDAATRQAAQTRTAPASPAEAAPCTVGRYQFVDDLDEPDACRADDLGGRVASLGAPASSARGRAGDGVPPGERHAGGTAEGVGTGGDSLEERVQLRDDAPAVCGAASVTPETMRAGNYPARPADAAAWPDRVAPPGCVPVPRGETSQAGGDAQQARLVVLVAGRGGCGKTTLAAAMALRAAALELRTAVLDLDLMFGNLATLLGVEEPHDAATLVAPARAGRLEEADIVRASMRVAPGLTVWGPVRAPEHAELMGAPVEQLIRVMRSEADLIIVDTSAYWSDAVAAAVAACDRCLVLGDARTGSVAAAERVIDLAARIGVPRTKMASVFNRFSAHDASEDAASRFEFTTALGLKGRIADGGSELAGLAALGHLDTAVEHPGTFRTSVCEFTDLLLRELGCSILAGAEIPEVAPAAERPRIRLPWKHGGGGTA